MSFKSMAQRRRALQMLKKGEIDLPTFQDWDKGTDYATMPEKKAKRRKVGQVKLSVFNPNMPKKRSVKTNKII